MRRFRPAISVLLFVLVGILVPVSALSIWATNTVYDSETFSQRAVEVLDSSAARKQLAKTITEEMVKAGNQQAINFRPAVQFGVEVVTDTDTFRAIFRNAVKRVHQAILENRTGETGLDLSESLSLITATVQLRSDTAASTTRNSGLGNTLESVTKRLADLRIWELEEIISSIAVISGLLVIVLSIAGIAVALDRRQAVVRLGLALILGSVVLLFVRFMATLIVVREISDADLQSAVGAALQRTTDDLKVLGLWLLGYGVVVAAAASKIRLTPAAVAERLRAWAGRRRATKWGTVFLAALLVLGGLVVTVNPWFWVLIAAYLGGLWLVYFGVWELVALIRTRAPATEAAPLPGSERRRLVVAGAAVLLVLGLVTAGGVILTRRASTAAVARGLQQCNGESDNCDVPLDQAVFPGTHNSMSSSLYPGWLFAEQIGTIKQQMDAGIRAFLIDTHYGVPTTVRLPGAESQVVVTDTASELSNPQGEPADPAVRERALAIAQRAKPAVNAQREIYLCHNYCEMGAVKFETVLAEVKAFLDNNPDDIIQLIIQDATTPAETAAVIEKAGLAEYAAVLRPGQPLPTLQELIDDGTRLIVFAEQGGPGAPEWYMKAYDWFQETPYAFKEVGDFNCKPNRGGTDKPLFLVNHWVEAAPPDPSKATKANALDVLDERLNACLQERGQIANVVAVDFAERGDLLKLAAALDKELRTIYRGLEDIGAITSATAGTPSTTTVTTIAPPPTTATVPATITTLPPPRQITDLGGGDPAQFCAAFPTFLDDLVAWATATVGTLPDQQGEVDLAYAPVLDRGLRSVVPVAPTELRTSLGPLQRRVDRAMAELRLLVPDAAMIEAQATSAAAALASPEDPDPITVQILLLEGLKKAGDEAAVLAAADRLEEADPDPLVALDLGEISDETARTAGYPCLAVNVTIEAP